MSLERIFFHLENLDTENRKFPATDLYNEGWMLRLILDWFSLNKEQNHELNFTDNSDWFSEALLPSAFLPRYRGDKLSESWTHADGVIGKFVIGGNGEGDLTLSNDTNIFIVTEAKMFSKLSPSVKNAKYYNQAARNVACMAETLNRARINPDSLKSIGFYVLAPKIRIDEGVFKKHMNKTSIKDIVKRRVSEYSDDAKEQWFKINFLPLLDKIDIKEISWESLIGFILETDRETGDQLDKFYKKSFNYNKYVAKKYSG